MFPLLPHLVSECINGLKISDKIKQPSVEKKYLEEKFVNIVIQINGKKKSLIKIEKDLEDKQLIESVKKDSKISSILNNKGIFKHIIVKNKLVNLIIK